MTKIKISSFNSKIKVISFQWPGETLISVSEIENNMTAQSTRPCGVLIAFNDHIRGWSGRCKLTKFTNKLTYFCILKD